LNPKDKHKL